MMKVLSVKNSIAFYLALVHFSLFVAVGQESNLLYFMKGVPQSYQVNPATQPGCRTFLGLPLASPFQFSFENSAFSLEDIIFPMGDSLVTFLHPEADKKDFLSNLNPVNYTQLFASTNLGSIGYRKNNLYYTFDFTEKIYTQFSYNDDLLNLLLLGNKRGDHFNFSNTNVDILSYFEFATGVSRNVNERLTTGSRLKILFGQANISTNNKDVSLFTDENWTLNSTMNIKLSIPGLDIPTLTDAVFKFDTIAFDSIINPLDIVQSAFGNVGLGIDLGMHYALTEKLTISASLIDLAVIRWSANAYTIRQDASFVYRGFEYKPGDTAMIDNYLDSLSSVFSFSTDSDPYYTMLPVKLYLGGTYQIIDQISIGILSRTEYYKKRIREQLTVSANFRPLKILAASLSYSIMNNTFNNIGFGLSSRLGPFNFYLLTDNIPTSYAVEQSSNMVIPYRARNLNFRIGFNLVFGCGKVKKDIKDLPLIY
jgi:hypothetical protein